MAIMMNKLAMINYCEVILEKYFFAQNHCEIQVRTILVCAVYSIKYGLLIAAAKILAHLLTLPACLVLCLLLALTFVEVDFLQTSMS
jgi:hypothetical protein